MWFPKWEKAAEELKIEKETIDEIEKIEDHMKTKAFLLNFSLILLASLILIGIKLLKNENVLDRQNLSFIIQVVSIISALWGTVLLAKGMIKNKYQIAVESTSLWGGKHPHLWNSLLSDKYNAINGFYMIILSVILQLIALLINIGR